MFRSMLRPPNVAELAYSAIKRELTTLRETKNCLTHNLVLATGKTDALESIISGLRATLVENEIDLRYERTRSETMRHENELLATDNSNMKSMLARRERELSQRNIHVHRLEKRIDDLVLENKELQKSSETIAAAYGDIIEQLKKEKGNRTKERVREGLLMRPKQSTGLKNRLSIAFEDARRTQFHHTASVDTHHLQRVLPPRYPIPDDLLRQVNEHDYKRVNEQVDEKQQRLANTDPNLICATLGHRKIIVMNHWFKHELTEKEHDVSQLQKLILERLFTRPKQPSVLGNCSAIALHGVHRNQFYHNASVDTHHRETVRCVPIIVPSQTDQMQFRENKEQKYENGTPSSEAHIRGLVLFSSTTQCHHHIIGLNQQLKHDLEQSTNENNNLRKLIIEHLLTRPKQSPRLGNRLSIELETARRTQFHRDANADIHRCEAIHRAQILLPRQTNLADFMLAKDTIKKKRRLQIELEQRRVIMANLDRLMAKTLKDSLLFGSETSTAERIGRSNNSEVSTPWHGQQYRWYRTSYSPTATRGRVRERNLIEVNERTRWTIRRR